MSFTQEEKVNLLFKKHVQKASTNNNIEFFDEPLFSRKSTISDRVWLQDRDIPATAPSVLSSLTDTDLDDENNSLVGSGTDGGSLVGKSYYHGGRSLIKKYLKVKLSFVIGSDDQAYRNDVLINAIPFNWDNAASYKYILYYHNGSGYVEVPRGPSGGDWVIDTDAGVLTFYGYNIVSGYIDASNPPYITFYRYVGEILNTVNVKVVHTEADNIGYRPYSSNADVYDSKIYWNNDLGTMGINTSSTDNTLTVSGTVQVSGNSTFSSNTSIQDLIIRHSHRIGIEHVQYRKNNSSYEWMKYDENSSGWVTIEGNDTHAYIDSQVPITLLSINTDAINTNGSGGSYNSGSSLDGAFGYPNQKILTLRKPEDTSLYVDQGMLKSDSTSMDMFVSRNKSGSGGLTKKVLLDPTFTNTDYQLQASPTPSQSILDKFTDIRLNIHDIYCFSDGKLRTDDIIIGRSSSLPGVNLVWSGYYWIFTHNGFS